LKGGLFCLWRRASESFLQWQMESAYQQFKRLCLLRGQFAVGPNAWCINLFGKDAIVVGQRVVCRGIIRCEAWSEHPRIEIGDDVYVGDDCIISCAEKVSIGSFTLLAHGVQLFDNDSHPIAASLREKDYRIVQGQQGRSFRGHILVEPIRIGSHVWIGMGSIIMKGVSIEDNSIVAAGSVVLSDVPTNCIVAGNPARVVRSIEEQDVLDTNRS